MISDDMYSDTVMVAISLTTTSRVVQTFMPAKACPGNTHVRISAALKVIQMPEARACRAVSASVHAYPADVEKLSFIKRSQLFKTVP